MSTSDKVERHHSRMRAEGLRPFEMWVPDTRTPQFAERVKQQTRKLKQAPSEIEALAITDEAAIKTEDWQ